MNKFDPKEHLIQLKGKDYLEAKWRFVWLVLEHEHYRITTEIIPTPTSVKGVCVHALVEILDGPGGKIIRSATGTKVSSGFAGGDAEKAETGGISRALGLLGFGTAFTDEYDELDSKLEPRVVDSPVAFTVTQRIVNAASKLFEARGDALMTRIDQAAGKILKVAVENFEKLSPDDLATVLKTFEDQLAKLVAK